VAFGVRLVHSWAGPQHPKRDLSKGDTVWWALQNCMFLGGQRDIKRWTCVWSRVVQICEVVDFLMESRWLYDGLNRIGCRDGLSFLLTPMVTDYKQVMRDRTTGSEIFGAWMKDVTCRTVARFRKPWPNKVPKDRRGAGVKQKKRLSKTNSSKEIQTRLRLTSHGPSVLNLSKFDESRTVGFDWSSENLHT